MNSTTRNARLEETACPHCHLLTRSDYKRCLHCGKFLSDPPRPRRHPIGKLNAGLDRLAMPRREASETPG